LPDETSLEIIFHHEEIFDINLPQDPQVGQLVDVVARKGAEEIAFQARLRFDAEADIRYYENGGILPMVVRKKLEEV